jgi:hypothetical protein
MPSWIASTSERLEKESQAHITALILASKVQGALKAEIGQNFVSKNRSHPIDRVHSYVPDLSKQQMRKPSKIKRKKIRGLTVYPAGLLSSMPGILSGTIKN